MLDGAIPVAGKCDIKTVAVEAGISRAALYRTYPHLKQEFEQRLTRLRTTGARPDPRDAHIARLTDDNTKLRTRVADLERQLTAATAFQVTAISQLAAQHQEIQRIRHALANPTNVVALPNGTTRT